MRCPIEHIVILCQENRSFDHYLGFLPGLESPRPASSHQLPDSSGRSYHPYHDPAQRESSPQHHWDESHQKWNGGQMDGFVVVDNGARPMGYLEESDHPYHAALAKAFAVCDRYFCSLIGPTTPNRLYLWTGTHGGWRHNPDESTPVSAQPMNWPTVADALSARGVSWSAYAVADGNFPNPLGSFSPYVFFPSTRRNPNMWFDINAFFAQAALGALPQVSWIVTQPIVSEHPPERPDLGQALVARVVQALMSNAEAWMRSALFLTYDEGGGFFDHVAPLILEHDTPDDHPWVRDWMLTQFLDDGAPIGPAFRVPFIAVSPWVTQGTVCHEPADHTSVIRFLEWRFGLEPLVTIAPGRRRELSDLGSGLFDFTTTPDPSTRGLPAAIDVSQALQKYSKAIPPWLPDLVGPLVE